LWGAVQFLIPNPPNDVITIAPNWSFYILKAGIDKPNVHVTNTITSVINPIKLECKNLRGAVFLICS